MSETTLDGIRVLNFCHAKPKVAVQALLAFIIIEGERRKNGVKFRSRTKNKKISFSVSSSVFVKNSLRSFLEVEKNNTLQKEGIHFIPFLITRGIITLST